VVLFGAAIDGQGGTNHINEQPQSYWTNLFEEEGYVCIDVLRQSLWNDKRVKWWYVQNTYLYVKYGSEALGLLHKHVGNDTVFDAVHPLNLKHKVNNLKELEERIENPTIQLCLSIIKKYVKNKIARLSL